jgi:hypothetical protein
MPLNLQDMPDVQETVCSLFLVDTVDPVAVDDDAPAGERWLTLRQDQELSKFAQVCTAWRQALQKHRAQQVAATAALFIASAPAEAVDIVNIDSYPEHTWMTLPRVSEMQLQVWLGSRLVFGIHFVRVGGPPTLTLTCGVPPRSDGGPWFSGPENVPVHALSWKPEDAFEPGERRRTTRGAARRTRTCTRGTRRSARCWPRLCVSERCECSLRH